MPLQNLQPSQPQCWPGQHCWTLQRDSCSAGETRYKLELFISIVVHKYTFTYIYIYIYIYLFIYICKYKHIYIYICIDIRAWWFVYIYIFIQKVHFILFPVKNLRWVDTFAPVQGVIALMKIGETHGHKFPWLESPIFPSELVQSLQHIWFSYGY